MRLHDSNLSKPKAPLPMPNPAITEHPNPLPNQSNPSRKQPQPSNLSNKCKKKTN